MDREAAPLVGHYARLSMEFSFDLTGAGWAEAQIAEDRIRDEDDDWVLLTASYQVDALHELLTALASLQAGSSRAVACWAEEPGEYRWIFERADALVTLRVLYFFRTLAANAESEADSVAFTTQCGINEMTRAFTIGIRAVLGRWGEDGYKAKWIRHEFPIDLLRLVESQIG